MITVTFALAAALQTATVDWPALPGLPYRAPPVITQQMQDFVEREVHARNCPVPESAGATQALTADVALLIDADGNVKTSIPKAIGCPTVEQYAAGLAAGFARNNLLPPVSGGDRWYRASLTFSWKK